MDGIVAHDLDTPMHTILLTYLFDYKMYLQHLDIRDEKWVKCLQDGSA